MKIAVCGLAGLDREIASFQPDLVISCVRTPLPAGLKCLPVWIDDIYNQQLIDYKNAIRAVLEASAERVLVNCQHGLSRSAALALAKLYQQEPSSVDRFLHDHQDLQPNPLILLLADEILEADFELLRRCRHRYKGRQL